MARHRGRAAKLAWESTEGILSDESAEGTRAAKKHRGMWYPLVRWRVFLNNAYVSSHR
jgi:hypothetical protein